MLFYHMCIPFFFVHLGTTYYSLLLLLLKRYRNLSVFCFVWCHSSSLVHFPLTTSQPPTWFTWCACWYCFTEGRGKYELFFFSSTSIYFAVAFRVLHYSWGGGGGAVCFTTSPDLTWRDLAWPDLTCSCIGWPDLSWLGLFLHCLTWLDVTWSLCNLT